MKIEKIERTQVMVDNIKKAQKELGYSDEQMGTEVPGLTPAMYKNIIRTLGKGGNRFVKVSVINSLAEFFNCSKDEILGQPSGTSGTPPLDFDEKNQVRHELFTYLNKDFETMKNLHFLLCNDGEEKRKEYKEWFRREVTIEKERSVLNFFKENANAAYQFFIGNAVESNIYEKNYTEYIWRWFEANQLFEAGKFESSLKKHLEIIYAAMGNAMFVPIAKMSILNVRLIEEKWDKFPSELGNIVESIPEILINTAEEVKKKIGKYLEQNDSSDKGGI